MTIPVHITVCCGGNCLYVRCFSLFLGMVSASIHGNCQFDDGIFGMSVTSVLQTFIQIILNCLFLYIAVMPVIAFAARIPNGHMLGTIIAFCLWLWRYVCLWKCYISKCLSCYCKFRLNQLQKLRSGCTLECIICLFSMIAVLMITAVFVFT